MSETKDPAIKLFGKTIPLPEISSHEGGGASISERDSQNQDLSLCENSNSRDEGNSDRVGEGTEAGKDAEGEKLSDCEQDEDGDPPRNSEDSSNPDASSEINENSKASVEKESGASTPSTIVEEQKDTSNSQEKPLKKPDKILPCPRCNSMDTKFCYYNNYNVNQPRHFCKNCQRYWTAGGTMRNVPVGAGRRKNKNSASHYRHLTVSEALQNGFHDGTNGVHLPVLKPNGTVLTFSSDKPLHESMATTLNLADKTMRNYSRNGFHKPEVSRSPVSFGGGQNGEDHSNKALISMSNSKDVANKSGIQETVVHNCQGFPPQVPCFPGAPWPYPWNSAQWSSSVSSLHGFYPPGIPLTCYPPPTYWGCTIPGTWNMPWQAQPQSPNATGTSSGPNSPTLGKHLRDENAQKQTTEQEPGNEKNSERCLWIPKTLRIDDPSEAAKSSIWATLGIKSDKGDSIGGRGLFKAFESKGDEKSHATETSAVLQANPAALSRSLNFQENS